MKRFFSWGALAVMAMVFAGCGDTKYVSVPAPMPESGPTGTAYVSKATPGNVSLIGVPYGETNVTFNEFTVAMDDVEDGILEFVVPEIYGDLYSDLIPVETLQNLRITQYGMQVGPAAACLTPRPASPENGWKNTTYAYIPTNVVIPRASIATFRIVGDVGWSWMSRVTVSLPDSGTGMFSDGISSHVIVRGATSGEILRVNGESLGSPIFLFDPFPYPIKG